VASINAVGIFQSAAVWSKGWRMASLIWRSPITPAWARNALRGAVTMAQRAKARSALFRQELDEQVERTHRGQQRQQCVRQSWAALNCQRGPRTGWRSSVG